MPIIFHHYSVLLFTGCYRLLTNIYIHCVFFKWVTSTDSGIQEHCIEAISSVHYSYNKNFGCYKENSKDYTKFTQTKDSWFSLINKRFYLELYHFECLRAYLSKVTDIITNVFCFSLFCETGKCVRHFLIEFWVVVLKDIPEYGKISLKTNDHHIPCSLQDA